MKHREEKQKTEKKKNETEMDG